MHKKIIILIFMTLIAIPARAQTRAIKVLIYNCAITFEKTILGKTDQKAEEEQYDFYSTIIPTTIARNLSGAGRYEVERIYEFLPLVGMGSGLFYEQMRKIGAAHSAQYIIAGYGTVRGKKLSVELFLINLKGQNLANITGESYETGAELKGIIDELAAGITRNLDSFEKENAKRYIISPFMKAYRALRGLSFGVKTGRFFIKGRFSNLYEDSEYIAPYLSYDILNWFGISADADYLSASNGRILVLKKSSMLLWGMTLNGNLTYRFFDHFGVSLSAGGGAAVSRIYLYGSDDIFNQISSRRQSVDPYLSVSASFNLIFKPVEVQFGSSYKHAFYKGTPLRLITVFCGIGFHL
jgi:hypothetical protein